VREFTNRGSITDTGKVKLHIQRNREKGAILVQKKGELDGTWSWETEGNLKQERKISTINKKEKQRRWKEEQEHVKPKLNLPSSKERKKGQRPAMGGQVKFL